MEKPSDRRFGTNVFSHRHQPVAFLTPLPWTLRLRLRASIDSVAMCGLQSIPRF